MMSETAANSRQQTVISSERLGLYQEIEADRLALGKKGEGSDHDQNHSAAYLSDIVDQQALEGGCLCDSDIALKLREMLETLTAEERGIFHKNMIHVAAVAVAAVEACDSRGGESVKGVDDE